MLIIHRLSRLVKYWAPAVLEVKTKKETHSFECVSLMLAPPIFPGRRQPGIVGRNELNYRVRNGNGWTLALIGTNLLVVDFASLALSFAESSLTPSLLAFLGKRFAGLPRRKHDDLCDPVRPDNKLDYKLFNSLCQGVSPNFGAPCGAPKLGWCTFTDSNRGPTD